MSSGTMTISETGSREGRSGAKMVWYSACAARVS